MTRWTHRRRRTSRKGQQKPKLHSTSSADRWSIQPSHQHKRSHGSGFGWNENSRTRLARVVDCMLRDYAHCDLLIWFFPFRLFCESPRANTSSKLYRRKWRAITDKSNKSSGLFIAWSNYRSFYGPINCILFWENKKSNKPDTRVRLRLPCLENMKNWRTKKSF